jgi:hypothetical protein
LRNDEGTNDLWLRVEGEMRLRLEIEAGLFMSDVKSNFEDEKP